MKKASSNRSSSTRQTSSQGRSSTSRTGAGAKRSQPQSSSGYGSSGRESGGRMRDEDGKFTTDDGGYYSNRNVSGSGREGPITNTGRGVFENGSSGYSDWDSDENYSDRNEVSDYSKRGQNQRNAPYRSSEEDNQTGGRSNRDNQIGSSWSRSNSGEGQGTDVDERDLEWGGHMSDGRDQEMGERRSGFSGGDREYTDYDAIRARRRSNHQMDSDDIEGQYDEDYRDRDSYRYGSNRQGQGIGRQSGSRK
jgi:hypothetical protein